MKRVRCPQGEGTHHKICVHLWEKINICCGKTRNANKINIHVSIDRDGARFCGCIKPCNSGSSLRKQITKLEIPKYLYQFPLSTITHYHKLNCLTQHKCNIPQF